MNETPVPDLPATTTPAEPEQHRKRRARGCILPVVLAFVVFWSLWAVNAYFIEIVVREDFSLPAGILAGVAALAEMLVLTNPDIARYLDSN